MAVNPYFKLYQNGNANEQALVDKFVEESIQMFGLDVVYLPRTLQKEDTLFHEDILSSFTQTFTIEGYIESLDQFGGEGDMISQFGMKINDQLNLMFAQNRFNTVVGHSPKEGDLVYFPLSKTVWEIKFTENEEQFYPLGTLPAYKVKLELFDYSGEDLATGIAEVDAIQTDYNNGLGDAFAGNTDIQTEGNAILDFTEQNPFGTP